ncbi:MAG: hypothetical protein NTY15_19725 [Planctomycetota bacterium]|nr:hypothetical protein [Planctomycetota bacterium]
MLIPNYWSEARAEHRGSKKQIIIRRWGWSEASLVAAAEHAEQRAADALERAIRGEKLASRERKVPYNGADGIPIREEVLARYDDVVVTRNSYGARCLNVSNVLIADIDLEDHTTLSVRDCLFGIAVIGLSIAAGLWTRSILFFVGCLILGIISVAILSFVIRKLTRKSMVERKAIAQQNVANYANENAGWSVRIYETPNGLRVFATHRLFEPDDPEVKQFFDACGTDPMYRRMCDKQKCFRARLTAKPWRIGIQDHLRPQPGVWPVLGEKLKLRNGWIEKYEQRAGLFAACHYLDSAGRGPNHYLVQRAVELHDRLSGAITQLPLA